MDFTEALTTYFPDAATGSKLTRQVHELLIDYDFDPNRTLLAVSTCPDELNRSVTGLQAVWGPAFQLGGLAGFPFTGPSGFQAFASHIPDAGAALIIYGPHVGITNGGDLGRVVRSGQTEPTLSCGSGVGAYMHLEEGGRPEDLEGQQRHVTSVVQRHLPDIQDSGQPMAHLPTVLFEEIDRDIKQLIPTDLDRRIVLLGGIQINTPLDEDDYFLVKEFSIRHPAEGTRTSVREKLA